jgi:hypothetical protein
VDRCFGLLEWFRRILDTVWWESALVHLSFLWVQGSFVVAVGDFVAAGFGVEAEVLVVGSLKAEIGCSGVGTLGFGGR